MGRYAPLDVQDSPTGHEYDEAFAGLAAARIWSKNHALRFDSNHAIALHDGHGDFAMKKWKVWVWEHISGDAEMFEISASSSGEAIRSVVKNLDDDGAFDDVSRVHALEVKP